MQTTEATLLDGKPLPRKGTLTHKGRVALYVEIINTKLQGPLTDFIVSYMRARAPSQEELNALNDALREVGWER